MTRKKDNVDNEKCQDNEPVSAVTIVSELSGSYHHQFTAPATAAGLDAVA